MSQTVVRIACIVTTPDAGLQQLPRLPFTQVHVSSQERVGLHPGNVRHGDRSKSPGKSMLADRLMELMGCLYGVVCTYHGVCVGGRVKLSLSGGVYYCRVK